MVALVRVYAQTHMGPKDHGLQALKKMPPHIFLTFTPKTFTGHVSFWTMSLPVGWPVAKYYYLKAMVLVKNCAKKFVRICIKTGPEDFLKVD